MADTNVPALKKKPDKKAERKPEKSGCFCGSQRPFARCCEPYLMGKRSAPTAEALMRSRYSAFCQRNVDYLVRTHHPDYRSADERKSLESNVAQTQWTQLLVVKTQKGQKKDKAGTVEFVAAYRPASLIGQATESQVQQLHERSRFVREQGEWFYTDGEMLPDYVPKRSQRCWCGSQLPFKRCHGRD